MDKDRLKSRILSETAYYKAMIFQINDEIERLNSDVESISKRLSEVNNDRNNAQNIINWFKGVLGD
ncbi:hypothetical protein [Thermoplasma volcanium]|uniref:hypothetical protein n=1 Tax=Thermoplasma volcanium TaxID=50339 RepID=UPI00064E6FA6|nr:hypothetical protein [Thermoplasma volcanium]